MKEQNEISTFPITNNYQRVITLLADTHVGAIHSVFPEGFKIYKGRRAEALININPVQKQLLEYFKNFSEASKKYNSDTLVVVGDLIAGMNPAECGRVMMFAEMDEQVKAWVYLIDTYFKHIKNVYILKGTGFHEAKYVDELEKCADKLRHIGYNAQYLGGISNLKICEHPKSVIMNIAHEGSDATVYPETPMARGIKDMLIGTALEKVPRAKIIVRAHKHIWAHIDRLGTHWIQVPCWQAFVPYEKARKQYYSWQPEIGGVLLLLDDESRIRIWEYLYKLPHMEDEITEG